MEIERKYLVRHLPAHLDTYESILMNQGYIVSGPGVREVRVRREGARYRLGIKSGSGIEREELEVDLSEEQFEQLWELTKGQRVSKCRYLIPWKEYTIELDVYDEALKGLIVAEVEFPDIESADRFSPPEWFGREVSEDVRYKNSRLTVDGLPEE